VPRRPTATRKSQDHRVRRPSQGSRGAPAFPDAQFWSELLATLKDLRAEVHRLASLETGGGALRHIDWARFQGSRDAAREGRERYWRETGTAK